MSQLFATHLQTCHYVFTHNFTEIATTINYFFSSLKFEALLSKAQQQLCIYIF